jgi:hypothetical protein
VSLPGGTAAQGTNPKAQVFLSHSGFAGDVKEVLEALVTGLSDAGDRPLLDRTHIPLGFDFSEEVGEFVGGCDAAVFIISKAALDVSRSWVYAEANQLKYRMRSPGFQAIPVFVEDLGPDDLQGRWDTTGLSMQNAVVDNDTATIVRRVVDGLDRTRRRVRAGGVMRALRSALDSVDPATLRQVAERLGDPGITTPDGMDVAVMLLKAGPDDVVAVAHGLAAARCKAAATAVLNLALPFTWVDRQAARALDAAVRASRPAAVNASEPWTPKCYLLCGSDEYPPWKVDEFDFRQGERADGLGVEARETLAWADAAIEDDDEPVQAPAVPRVFAVKSPRLDEDVVQQFQQYIGVQNLGLVFLACGQRWADVDEALHQILELLTPELDPGWEAEARRRYVESWALVQELVTQADAWMTELQ